MAKKRKRRKKYIKINRRLFYFILAILLIGNLVAIIQNWQSIADFTGLSSGKFYTENKITIIGKRTETNYGKEIERAAKEFDIPANYLKALASLECSGNKPPGKRFERHVYHKLKKVKAGTLSKFENLTHNMLKNTPDDALKNLATSWGPFQLMGYKCIHLGVYVKDIRGEKAVWWGTKWIKETYGNYLKSKRYSDAFHIHNTGREYPKLGKTKTHDPNYVSNGLKFMQFFN